MPIDDRTEWIETDGLGGFASGTVSGIRTRRYHALLLSATTPPTGRVVLVNGLDAWLDGESGSAALSTQRYEPDVIHRDGASHITRFTHEPWPTWLFGFADGTSVKQEIVARHGVGTIAIVWTLLAASGARVLRVRPFLSGRDYHALHHENPSFAFSVDRQGAANVFGSYEGLPKIAMLSNGEYRHEPDWYRRFLYSAERERGLDDSEDLASPGELTWRLDQAGAEAVLLLDARGHDADPCPEPSDAVRLADVIRAGERQRRESLGDSLNVAADAYIVKRNAGRTIVAGYPWFTDWGRDTFIALRGLCLATGRLEDARDILLEWAAAVSDGMLPNRFPDRGETPEFNAVDASLWFVVAAHELLQTDNAVVSEAQRDTLVAAMLQIVRGYARGTRYGIRMDADGLLAAGVPGVQLSWMDARVGDRVITPRIGKPVEVQALWLNALAIAAGFDPTWRRAFDTGIDAFRRRFWCADLGRLADVVDVDHRPGTRDDTFRPNQILAIGGLPLSLLDMARARQVVDAVEQSLVTPLGLRSLAPADGAYVPFYRGGPAERDGAYHQGTVWPWLMGAFVDAWVRVRGDSPAAKAEARSRFVEPLLAHRETAGLGHVSEIADGSAPFTPRGCPFQAWSLAELIRLERQVLARATATTVTYA